MRTGGCSGLTENYRNKIKNSLNQLQLNQNRFKYHHIQHNPFVIKNEKIFLKTNIKTSEMRF